MKTPSRRVPSVRPRAPRRSRACISQRLAVTTTARGSSASTTPELHSRIRQHRPTTFGPSPSISAAKGTTAQKAGRTTSTSQPRILRTTRHSLYGTSATPRLAGGADPTTTSPSSPRSRTPQRTRAGCGTQIARIHTVELSPSPSSIRMRSRCPRICPTARRLGRPLPASTTSSRRSTSGSVGYSSASRPTISERIR